MAFARWLEMVSQQVCVRGVGLKVGTGRVAMRRHLALDGEAQRDLVAPRGAPLPARVHQDEVRVVRLERGAVRRVVCSTGGVLDRA